MKRLAFAVAVAGGCAEPSDPTVLDLDLVVTQSRVTAYFNGSDRAGHAPDEEQFPKLGDCLVKNDVVGPDAPSCLSSLTLIADGTQMPLGMPLPVPFPSQLELEIRGCGYDGPRTITLQPPPPDNATLDVQFGDPVHVIWRSNFPFQSVLLSFWSPFETTTCHVTGASRGLDNSSAVTEVYATVFERADESIAPWGPTRIWYGANAYAKQTP